MDCDELCEVCLTDRVGFVMALTILGIGVFNFGILATLFAQWLFCEDVQKRSSTGETLST